MKTSDFISHLDDNRIVEAIRLAERGTSGEIRLVVSARSTHDPIHSGKLAFVRLGMDQTAQRNSVLLYLCPATQQFAILGDQGIHSKDGRTLWVEAASLLQADLRAGLLVDGIIHAIERIGTSLKEHFPVTSPNPDELPNHIDREEAR